MTFGRGVTPEPVIEGFGMDPGSARPVIADLVEAALASPAYGDDIAPACPDVRVGRAGERAFAIEVRAGIHRRDSPGGARRSSQAANWPGVRTPSSSTAV